MQSAFRIVKTKHAKSAFDGEGARLYGGRWNSKGTSMVYTSEHASLAQLELLVHIDRSMLLNAYSTIEVAFEEECIEVLDISRLPRNWDEYPAPVELRQIGDRWARERRSVVLRVPSVVLNTESNFLLNPAHADFDKVTIGNPTETKLDPRLK